MDFSVKIEPDEDGYTGRECPECEKYFKIKFGTGLPDATGCHCPYCNHIGPQDEFWTKQQVEYAQSVALNKISGDLINSLQKMEMKPKRNQFVSIGIQVKGRPTPITYYSEKELEEKVECEMCTLQYAIYGAFGYCPDCGTHNSKQIVEANFDLVLIILDLASSAEEKIKLKLVENALEDCVSAFDGYAREHCSDKYNKISFQNIVAARNKIEKDIDVDIFEGLDSERRLFVNEQFQKRHLLAHKMRVIDEEYVKKVSGSPASIGRKVSISERDVRLLAETLVVIAGNLFNGLPRSS